MESDSDDEILLDNFALKFLLLRRNRKCNVHDVNKKRKELGEYYQLFKELKNHPDRLFDYIRMDLTTFNYILENVSPQISVNWTNFNRTPIGVEERLVITIR